MLYLYMFKGGRVEVGNDDDDKKHDLTVMYRNSLTYTNTILLADINKHQKLLQTQQYSTPEPGRHHARKLKNSCYPI